MDFISIFGKSPKDFNDNILFINLNKPKSVIRKNYLSFLMTDLG